MRGSRYRNLALFLLPAMLLITAPEQVAAQLRFGVRGGVYAGPTDPFVGLEVLYPLRQQVTLDPNLELVFGNHENVTALNLDALYELRSSGTGTLWVGAGPAVVFRDRDRGGNRTDLGLNLLLGAGLRPSRGLTPYVQGKILLSNESRATLAFGLRF
jgi:hypothetical protein